VSNLFVKKLGIDLGTANTLVFVPGKGIVLNEPSVVAVSEIDNKILAIGIEAKEMIGKTPDSIIAYRPMKDGVIADYRATEAMLRYFISKSMPKWSLFKPDVMISVPAGVTSTQRRAVVEAAIKAGARNAYVAKERAQIARRVQAYETREGIVRGDIKATPAKRYWALVELIRNAGEDHDSVLRAMPYRDFLNSIYWSIIRDYALYRAKYSCALCHKTHGLQVHHRTYEHRGSEYNHLEDLIVLCGNCHAKFHDKLPAGE
jgi:hypothetical protein